MKKTEISHVSPAGAPLAPADGALPEGGHWNIQIEEPERRWRLVASAKGFTKPVAFESATP